MAEKRSINNNPTGKPFCCHPECDDDATLDICNPPFDPDSCTQSCEKGDHVTYLLQPGGTVSPVEQDDESWS